MINKTTLQLIWVSSLILVTVLSLLPGKPHPQLFWNVDKLQHAAAYAWLAFLPTLSQDRRRLLPILAGLVLWGIALELFQSFVPFRDSSFADAAANATGVVLGTLIGRKIATRPDQNHTHPDSDQPEG